MWTSRDANKKAAVPEKGNSGSTLIRGRPTLAVST
jgi:hypothetical protein